jgi:F-type H+-transporting ATPase subunit gamma
MASVREIKRRIQSVKNISQVTRALEAVSASKAKRAQQQAERSRAYTQAAMEILVNLAGQPSVIEHPLMVMPEKVETIDLVLITSDRGLAGAYNMNIIRAAEDFIAALGVECRWITVGRKGRDYLLRRKRNVIAEFSDLPANLSFRDVKAIGDLLVSDFLEGRSQQVFVAYTDYINVLTQRPAVTKLLPFNPMEEGIASAYYKAAPPQTVANREYLYEPQASLILDEIVPRFTGLQVYQAVLESNASEQAARMVAMRNATDNAVALSADLTLEYNKARQTAITAEMLDIVGGVEALKAKGHKASAEDNEALFERADSFISTMQTELQDHEDDLQRIEGIGPKVAAALKASGIKTFKQIMNMSADELERIVKDEHQVRVIAGASQTWPKQAQFIVEGDLDGLKRYQDQLIGGREA